MGLYRLKGPAAGVVCADNATTFVQTILADALWELKGVEIWGNTRSTDTGHLPIEWLLQEFDLDGSTGTANNPLSDDPRITTQLPTGKHTYSGSGTSIPRMSSGSPRFLWSRKIYPAQSFNLPLVDANGDPIVIRAGRLAALSIIIPAAGSGIVAQTVDYGLAVRDGG